GGWSRGRWCGGGLLGALAGNGEALHPRMLDCLGGPPLLLLVHGVGGGWLGPGGRWAPGWRGPLSDREGDEGAGGGEGGTGPQGGREAVHEDRWCGVDAGSGEH